MCYYNTQKLKANEFIRLLQVEKTASAFDFLNRSLVVGFDYGPKAVLKPVPGQLDFDIVEMEWGFIPPYVKNEASLWKLRMGYKDESGNLHPPITTLNAVGETLLQPNKMFRAAALNRRCLILSTGFYEWRHIHGINKRTGEPKKTAEKYPYFVHVKDRSYFFLAGIWQAWTDKETGVYKESCAVITTAANALMQQVHNSKKRMPVILNEEQAFAWMFEPLTEAAIQQLATTQYPAENMEAWSVKKDFLQSACPADPFVYPELPPLNHAALTGKSPTQGALFNF